MSQTYCPTCLNITDISDSLCPVCETISPPEKWPITTTFRHPWLGYVIDKRFQLVQYVGYGAMGDVYRAKSLSVGVSFAAKVIDRRIVPSIGSLEELASRLDREVAAMAVLQSPYVTRVIDYFLMEEEIFVLLSEFAPGKTLGQLVKEQGQLKPDVTIEIARQVLEALAELSRWELVHRDLKPENLMVQVMASGRPFVRLLDFGIVKTVEQVRITQGFVGTPHFAAPEQALDSASVDGRGDLYSLGCILYYALTGSVPFPGDSSVAVLNKHLHSPVPRLESILPENSARSELARLIYWLMEKDPVNRPGSPLEVLEQPLFSEIKHSTIIEYDEKAAPLPVEDNSAVEMVTANNEELNGLVAMPLLMPSFLSAVSFDCNMLAAMDDRHNLTVWAADDEENIRKCGISREMIVKWLFFSDNGKLLYVAASNGMVIVYEADTLEIKNSFSLPPSNYRWIGPSRLHNDRLIALTPGSVFIWDIAKGIQHFEEGEFIRNVSLVRALGKLSTVVIETATGRRLSIVEKKTGGTAFEVDWLKSHTGVVGGRVIDMAPTGQLLVLRKGHLSEGSHYHNRIHALPQDVGIQWMNGIALADGNYLCLSVNGELYKVMPESKPHMMSMGITSIASGNSRTGAVALGADGFASFWNSGETRFSQKVPYTEPSYKRFLISCASPDLKRFSIVKILEDAATLHLFNSEDGLVPKPISLPRPICYLRWGDLNKAAFAITSCREVMIIDIEAGESVSVKLAGFEAIVGCIISGGRLLCAGDRNGIIRSINPTTHEAMWLYKTAAPINTMASNSTTSQVAVGRLDGKVDLLDSKNGVRLKTLDFSSEDMIESASFSPDGRYLAVLTRTEGLVMELSAPESITRFSAPYTGGNKNVGIDDSGHLTFISIDEDGVRIKGASEDDEEREIEW